MVFIYAILLPRYARLLSPAVAFLVDAVSYPLMHVFEYWTRYDSLYPGAVSVIFVMLTFFPAGVMKSFLTMRTGNAWVHMGFPRDYPACHGGYAPVGPRLQYPLEGRRTAFARRRSFQRASPDPGGARRDPSGC
ncbi:MAG: hypothetical protein WBQ79_20575 [Acidobacteriaceae bacterium]